ncbi:28S ribosomal protein S14, mitochondrial [Folsomia candida]|uniref:28S ribosomal protein S14, mitochondrial n=1 Tax=Folsomia candida TaxID=158441 RepID=UPI0016055849|nr:28S ribosomal protein S14, mitochondrial [Folsomia candida]
MFSSFNLGKIGPLVQCRFASHAVMKSKPVIPKPPKQPPKKYDIEWNPQPGGLQGWTDWRMKKNYRNRQICVEWGLEHTLLKAMKNQVILPREIQELAMEDFHAMPIHAAYLTLHERCAISSRGTGVVRNWRISRFFFRHLSDYNKMSGVRRGIW